MAYENVQSKPGLTLTIIDQFSSPAPGLLTPDGTAFNGTALGGASNSAGAGVRIEFDAGYTAPFNVRATATATGIDYDGPTASSFYVGTPIGGGHALGASPTGDSLTDSDVVASTVSGSCDIVYGASTDFGYLLSIGAMSLVIEIDAVHVAQEKWTNFVNCVEID